MKELIVKELKADGFEFHADKYEFCKKRCACWTCDVHPIPYYTPISCSLRICNECGSSRWKKLRDKFYTALFAKQHRLKLLTLTYGDISDFTYDDVNNVIAKARRLFKESSVDGALVVAEVKTSNQCDMYLHLHCIVSSNYIPQDILSKRWEELTGRRVVDIRKVYSPKKALNYIAKYLTKQPDLSTPKLVVKFFKMFFNKRMVRTYGYFFRLKMEKESKRLECELCGGWMLYVGVTSLDKSEYLERNKHYREEISRIKGEES